MNDNCCTPGGLPAPAAPGLNPEAFDPCKSAIPVVICDGAPAGPVTLTGADCAGAPVDAAAPKGQIAYAVQPAGQVYKVQLCAPGAQDRELVVLCKANGDKVTLQYDVLTTPPTLVSQFNLNTNAADTTPLTALTDCGIEKLDYGSAVDYCANGAAYTRIDVFDAQSQFVIGSVWQDEAGNQVAAPVGARKGTCEGTVFETPVHWCAAGVCAEGIALYTRSKANGVVLSGVVNTLGAPVTPTPAVTVGACPVATVTDREICASMKIGEAWNLVERTTTDACGNATVAFFDPDVSPMPLVPAADVFQVRHAGACDCCRDSGPIVVADPSSVTINKTVSPVVDIGQPVQYTVTVTNNGPGAADGVQFFDQTPDWFQHSGFAAWSYAGGAAGGATLGNSTFEVGTLPAGAVATAVFDGAYAQPFQYVANTAVGIAPASNPGITFTGDGQSTAATCAREWTEWHEWLVPASTLFGTLRVGAGLPDTFGTVDKTTGTVSVIATLPGANLNALGLNKSNNNAVFLDRNNGNIYTANSPGYAIVQTSVLQAGAATPANSIMGAVAANGDFYLGSVAGGTTLNVAVVDPFTGAQTPVASLNGVLATNGQSGYDFDFAPNGDLYLMFGGRFYVSTLASGYAGWTLVGNPAVPSTSGSVAYDQGTLLGSTSTGQLFSYDIATGVTTLGVVMAGGYNAVDFAGALDPICKTVWLNNCDGLLYEANRVQLYVGAGNAVAGPCA